MAQAHDLANALNAVARLGRRRRPRTKTSIRRSTGSKRSWWRTEAGADGFPATERSRDARG